MATNSWPREVCRLLVLQAGPSPGTGLNNPSFSQQFSLFSFFWEVQTPCQATLWLWTVHNDINAESLGSSWTMDVSSCFSIFLHVFFMFLHVSSTTFNLHQELGASRQGCGQPATPRTAPGPGQIEAQVIGLAGPGVHLAMARTSTPCCPKKWTKMADPGCFSRQQGWENPSSGSVPFSVECHLDVISHIGSLLVKDLCQQLRCRTSSKISVAWGLLQIMGAHNRLRSPDSSSCQQLAENGIIGLL